MVNDPAGPRITPTENGPYQVSGWVPVHRADGTPAAETEEEVYLCRCGGSSNKPYCDDTHLRKPYDGTEVADRGTTEARRDIYDGDGIAIYDDRSICAHIGNCTDNLASVFKLGVEPWIEPTGARAEAIARQVALCPSGALSYALAGSSAPVEAEREPGITASKNGPYLVVGKIPVVSEDGTPYEVRARFALCRCGGSRNKPFCDGTHWHNGFRA